MTQIKIIAILFLVVVGNTLPAQSQKYSVSGVVIDSVTGQPMANVNISVVGTTGGGITNQAGEFSLRLVRIPSILYFSHVGYSIGSCQIEKAGEKNIRITLIPEIREIEEVTVRAEKKIAKVIRGDTLNILDYELDGDRLILLASPYRNQADLRIYLTNLHGNTLDYIKVKKAGKQIQYPEIMSLQTEFLIRDFTGQVNYLDKECVHEVSHAFDKLSLGYGTPYPDFLGRVLPVKYEMAGKLVFQVSTSSENFTWYFGRGSIKAKLLKKVEDKNGPYRYVRSKCVSAPVFRKGDELYVFDFFRGHFEVFDLEMNPIRRIPISFQYTDRNNAIFTHSKDVDVFNFTQNILFDEKSGKAYAFFRKQSSNRQSLREINLDTGKTDRVIEIPEYPNISNIRVYNNTIYFLYDTKIYPYYRLLYRMVI
ncbi:MAG: carboxypeptidase-like regulatory domain-containing protein [Bacteroidales bacterium]|nr:carboxypeptidase-like regulatory domain-containing protein [Bacteroidales bacterium]